MKSVIGLIMLVGVTMSLYCHNISGYCYRTDTGQVMIGGWGPWGFPPELPFGWNIFSGEYTGQVPDGWSGTITPHCSMPGTFEPASITYTNVTENLYNQVYAFTPVLRNISGFVRISDTNQGIGEVLLAGFPIPVMTNANGYYSANVPLNWDGMVVPSYDYQEGSFNPGIQYYSNVTQDVTNQNYSWVPVTYLISGRITDTANGEGMAGIALYGLPGNPVTDAAGRYTVSVLSGFSGRVTPSTLPVGIFNPSNRIHLNVRANLNNQNFTYSLLTYIISGRITRGSDGQGVGNVEMNGFSEHIVTDSEGNYSAVVPYGFSGEITPNSTLPGYFTPETRIYDAVHADQFNQYFSMNATGNEDNLLADMQFDIYPNPFKDKVTIIIQTGKADLSGADIYNIRGEKVKHLSGNIKAHTEQKLFWDGMDKNGCRSRSGVYFIRVTGCNTYTLKKVVFISG